MGGIARGQTGGTSLPAQEKEEKMEAELAVGGARVWVVAAARSREGRVSERALCPTCLLHFTKPQSPAWHSPAQADHNLPCYQHCHLLQRHAGSAVNSETSANPVFSQRHGVWPSGPAVARLHRANGASLRPH